MTLQTVLAWSICRSVGASSVAIPLAVIIWKAIRLRRHSDNRRMMLAAAALLPLFVPDLLTGFAYRLTSARLLHSVAATEGLYALILLFRVTALQVAVLLLLPNSTISAASLHSWQLLKTNSKSWWWTWMRMQIAGPYRTLIIAWMTGVLIGFQDFETAALLQIDQHPIAWTVWLFDAHVANESLSILLKHITVAMACQICFLLPLFFLVSNVSVAQATNEAIRGTADSQPNSTGRKKFATCFLLVSVFVLVAWPVMSHVMPIFTGLRTMVEQGSALAKLRQIFLSFLPAFTAAVVSLLVIVTLRGFRSRALQALVIAPGLCGSLFLSLTLLRLFQYPALNAIYDTWLPMIFGQILFALPRALLLVVILEVVLPVSSVHLASMMLSAQHRIVVSHGRHLIWRLGSLRWIVAIAILAHWCFWDVSIITTLRPVTFEPIVTRLYNEMHYGRTESLVAITLLTLLMPCIIFSIGGFLWKFVPKQRLTLNG